MTSYEMPIELASRDGSDGMPIYIIGEEGTQCDFYRKGKINYINAERVYNIHDRFRIAIKNIMVLEPSLSVRRLCKMLGYSAHTSLTQVLNGHNNVGKMIVARLQKTFNINPHFFEREGYYVDPITGKKYDKEKFSEDEAKRRGFQEPFVSDELWLTPESLNYNKKVEARWTVAPPNVVKYYEEHPRKKLVLAAPVAGESNEANTSAADNSEQLKRTIDILTARIDQLSLENDSLKKDRFSVDYAPKDVVTNVAPIAPEAPVDLIAPATPATTVTPVATVATVAPASTDVVNELKQQIESLIAENRKLADELREAKYTLMEERTNLLSKIVELQNQILKK